MQVSDSELRELYTRYGPVIFHRARSILGDPEEANDAVQETFARVIRHHESFRQEASPLTWMIRISTNLCLNQLRNRRGREAKHVHRKDEIFGDGASAPTAPKLADAELVRRLLADADEDTRAILVHLYFDDMTREEAAKIAGISLPTLRKRVDFFFRRARRLIEDDRVPLAMVVILCVLEMAR